MADTRARDNGENTLVKRLASLETGQVSDVLDEAGLPNQVLTSALLSLKSGQRFAGRAVCVSGEPLINSAHMPAALPSETLEEMAKPDTVFVIGTGGFASGTVLGGFVAYSLQREGVRGVLTDGAIRDADETRGLDFPVIYASINPINGARRWRITKRDVPVSLPGQTSAPVTINPGDFILADGDGVVVVPAAVAEQIIADSEQLALIEKKIGSELRSGGTRVQVFANNPRFKHIRKV